MIGYGVLFVALNVINIYGNTLGDANNDVVLVKYSVQGKSYTIMKRSTKRSIYCKFYCSVQMAFTLLLWTRQ